MNRRGRINLGIDMLLLSLFAFLVGTGFLIHYILPPRKELLQEGVSGVRPLFLVWDRHQWGDLHFYLAVLFIVVLILHLFFHEKNLETLFGQFLPSTLPRRLFAAGFLLLIFGLLFFPFLLPWKETTESPQRPAYSRQSSQEPQWQERELQRQADSSAISNGENGRDRSEEQAQEPKRKGLRREMKSGRRNRSYR